jgi:hypothetical protein
VVRAGLFGVRVDNNASAVLADDQLLAAGDLDQALGSNRVEATAARVTVEDGDDGEVVVHALTDTGIGAHRTGIDLGSQGVAADPQLLLFGSRGLLDDGELVALGSEIFVADLQAASKLLEQVALLLDGHTQLTDILDGDLAEEVLVLELLVDGVVLTAVADVVQLLLVFLDLGVVVDDTLLVVLDRVQIFLDQGVGMLDLAFDRRNVAFEGLYLGGELTAELDDLLDLVFRLLLGIKSLELLLDVGLGVGKGLLQGYEGFPLIDGGFDFLDFRCRHIKTINIESDYCLSAHY